jgi:hypothetical protein
MHHSMKSLNARTDCLQSESRSGVLLPGASHTESISQRSAAASEFTEMFLSEGGKSGMATDNSSSCFQRDFDEEAEEEPTRRRVATRIAQPITDSDDDDDEDDDNSVGTATPCKRNDPITNPGQYRTSLTSNAISPSASTSTWQTQARPNQKSKWVKVPSVAVSVSNADNETISQPFRQEKQPPQHKQSYSADYNEEPDWTSDHASVSLDPDDDDDSDPGIRLDLFVSKLRSRGCRSHVGRKLVAWNVVVHGCQ